MDFDSSRIRMLYLKPLDSNNGNYSWMRIHVLGGIPKTRLLLHSKEKGIPMEMPSYDSANLLHAPS